MAHKVAIAGLPNSGKSFSRRTIKDGENVIILSPSNKATHLKDSKGKTLQPFGVKTAKFSSSEEAIKGLSVSNIHQVLSRWNKELKPGSFKPENITGNFQLIESLTDLPIWMQFVSKHLPWIHTVIIPDFTHFISRVISDDGFINRKAGGEAYQRFWELAASALKNFIISIDNYRHDLIVVTEYHAEFDSDTGFYDIFVPAGKMLTEKFKPPSYYDILVFTDVQMPEDDEEDAKYRFVTKPTRKYPYARTMNLFEQTYIENDLQLVLDRVREYLGIPWKVKEAEAVQ